MMIVENLGLINYQKAYERQLELRDKLMFERAQDEVLLVCSHNPIVTLGKKSTKNDLSGWSGDLIEIERGGKATYHGPGQIIIYPILDLSKRNNDIHLFLRHLEEATVETLKEFQVKASGNPSNSMETTGVWIKNKKIASIGVAIKRWITYHGIALNVNQDPLAFSGISPCGYKASTMISLEEITNKKIDKDKVESIYIRNILEKLNNF